MANYNPLRQLGIGRSPASRPEIQAGLPRKRKKFRSARKALTETVRTSRLT